MCVVCRKGWFVLLLNMNVTCRKSDFIWANIVLCTSMPDGLFQWYDIIKHSLFMFWVCLRSQSTPTRCPLIVCVCVLGCSQRGLKGTSLESMCPKSKVWNVYKTKATDRAARTKQISALVVPFLSCHCCPSSVHPQNTAQATFSFVLMNWGM